MAKPSIFRDFMKALTQNWKTSLPSIRPVDRTLDPTMPKASTFLAGHSPSLGLYVFVSFQHSRMAWRVGHFAVNVILSRTNDAPPAGPPFTHYEEGAPLTEGLYRLGDLVHGRDKWWHLKKGGADVGGDFWHPSSYRSDRMVVAEAVDDVTRDVVAGLRKLGITATVRVAG